MLIGSGTACFEGPWVVGLEPFPVDLTHHLGYDSPKPASAWTFMSYHSQCTDTAPDGTGHWPSPKTLGCTRWRWCELRKEPLRCKSDLWLLPHLGLEYRSSWGQLGHSNRTLGSAKEHPSNTCACACDCAHM